MKWVVVTEQNKPWVDWAGQKQFLLWPFADRVLVPNGSSLETAAAKLEQAAQKAQRGMVILSVGHGGQGDGNTDEGFFDLGPGSAFRVAGNNAVLTGESGTGKRAQVSAFYDFVPTNAVGSPKSPKLQDEEHAKSSDPQVSGPAKTRLAHWARYLQVGKTFQANGVGAILLLTCKVGNATDFLKRVRSQLGVPIAAYKRRVMGAPVDYFDEFKRKVATRTRIFLEGDADGRGTNVEMGEFFVPTPGQSDWTILL